MRVTECIKSPAFPVESEMGGAYIDPTQRTHAIREQIYNESNRLGAFFVVLEPRPDMDSAEPKLRHPTRTLEPAPLSVRPRKTSKRKNAAGRPTLVELERRKAKVLEVAQACFIREGYAATSLVDIAKGAGVATRTLTQHFGDKEALFRAVMESQSGLLPPGPEVRKKDALHDVVTRVAEYVSDVTFAPATIDMMRLAIAESKRFPDLISRLNEKGGEHFVVNVQRVFDELVLRRAIRDDDTAGSARMFIDLILGDAPLRIFVGWNARLQSIEQLNKKVSLFIAGRWGAAAVRSALKKRA